MPRLLLLAPCERVILADDKTISLITLIETLRLQVETKEEIPADAAAPFAWHVLVLWVREDKDKDGIFYNQKLQLVMEDGKIPIEKELSLPFAPGKPNSRGLFKILGFPIPKENTTATIRLSLRTIESLDGWTEIATYPVKLELPSKEPSEERPT